MNPYEPPQVEEKTTVGKPMPLVLTFWLKLGISVIIGFIIGILFFKFQDFQVPFLSP